jgi:hypothetical protein
MLPFHSKWGTTSALAAGCRSLKMEQYLLVSDLPKVKSTNLGKSASPMGLAEPFCYGVFLFFSSLDLKEVLGMANRGLAESLRELAAQPDWKKAE